MIYFDFQFASRIRSKRKLSVLSIVKAFDKFLCGIAPEVGLPPKSHHSLSGDGSYNLITCKFIVSYEFPFLFL